MSRIRFGAALALVIALVATVGGQDPKKDPPKKDPPKVDPGKVDPPKTDPPKVDPNAKKFDLKLEKDKKFYQEMKTEVTQVIKVQGQDLTQKQDSTFQFKWTPTKQEGDKWIVEQEVEGLKMTIDISGNVITYDSSKARWRRDRRQPDTDAVLQIARRAPSSPPRSTRTRRSRRWKARRQFIEDLGAGSPQMDTLLKKIMTDDALKQMCDPIIRLDPRRAEEGRRYLEEGQHPQPRPHRNVHDHLHVQIHRARKKDMDKIEVETSLKYNAPKAMNTGRSALPHQGREAHEREPDKGRDPLQSQSSADRIRRDQHLAEGRSDRHDRRNRHEGRVEPGTRRQRSRPARIPSSRSNRSRGIGIHDTDG